MIQELVYTSAARGLKAGSRGFCTVLSTQGMPAPLAVLLEGLSAYRHVFPPDHPQVDLNPVTWAHSLLTVGGKRYSVLSRVADHGLDYSERTNKLAHHLVLESSDRPRGGPAWLLAQPGVMRSDWDGEPRVIPPGRGLPVGDVLPSVCQAWQDMTGDAGWAGVLAESFLKDPDRPVYLLFRPGMDVLPLIREAISLLPVERRWDVTFSTYATNVAKGVTCQWRCLLADAPEAHQSRRFVRALRLNLCEALGRAEGGALVDLARTGRSAAPVETASLPVARKLPETDERDDAPYQLQRQKAAPPPTRLPTRPQPPARPPATEGGRRRFLTVAFVAVILLITVGLTIARFVRQPSKQDTEPEGLAAASETQPPPPTVGRVDDSSTSPLATNDPPPTIALQAPEEVGGSQSNPADESSGLGDPAEKKNETEQPTNLVPDKPKESDRPPMGSTSQETDEGETHASNEGASGKSPADEILSLPLPNDSNEALLQLNELDRLDSASLSLYVPPRYIGNSGTPIEYTLVSSTHHDGLSVATPNPNDLEQREPFAAFTWSGDTKLPPSLRFNWTFHEDYWDALRWCVLAVRSDNDNGTTAKYALHERVTERLVPEHRQILSDRDKKLCWELPVRRSRPWNGVGPVFLADELVIRIGESELRFEGLPRSTEQSRNDPQIPLNCTHLAQQLLSNMQVIRWDSIDADSLPQLQIIELSSNDRTSSCLELSMTNIPSTGIPKVIRECCRKLVFEWSSLSFPEQIDPPRITESTISEVNGRSALVRLQEKLETQLGDADDVPSSRRLESLIATIGALIADSKEVGNLEASLNSIEVSAARIFYVVQDADGDDLEIDVIHFDQTSDKSARD